ncbi:ABC transporter permease [Janibacter hoylei]|uniref:Transport permease protein n=1 Tax=Janibacter hoylei PVAS-1 TaxID=1210046 RepID=K1DXV2_9MICO|nr:ABC transporter permease [Janibacter hoylei]EKA61214.1 polysaccharide/polyol phosphate ABC transporter permease [Janibacter hoylei PVAS-1]MCT1617809.1 ABC transporter permease [Janibacter hoylei]MCT2293735.1 ABC transporter permease [Janibacter hoylei]MCW4601991.1 ABC transporter permease [Janibacter hoylei]RWU82744.1 ABC transporter permease [Janibacter hoylei PVAS-1]
MTEAPPRASLPSPLTPKEAADLAASHGLRTLSERPQLGRYLADLWQRRSFLWTLSSAQTRAQNEGNHLGQLWALLNPAFLIGSYFLIFGLLLDTRGGVANFVAFLAIGVIMFAFTSSVITRGAKAISSNTSLVRALHFPRAILPMSVMLTELLAAVPAFALLFGLMLITGETPDWEWLLFPVAVIMQGLALLGVAFICARIVNASRDMGNLIPVMVRLLRYVSGVFFPVAHYAKGLPHLAQDMLVYQPFSLMLTTGRQALLTDPDHDVVLTDWLVMAAWAIGLVTIGLVVFWRDEARYGRG